MNIPTWMENTLAGVLLTVLIGFIWKIFDNFSARQKTEAGVGTQVLEQLAERDAHIKRTEDRNDELYERNKKLTDDYTGLMREMVSQAANFTNLLTAERDTARKEIHDSFVQVHEKLRVSDEQGKKCEEAHQECSARLGALERLIAATALPVKVL